MKKPFHLAWFLSQGYGPKSWRGDWPGSDIERWMMPDLFVGGWGDAHEGPVVDTLAFGALAGREPVPGLVG